MIKKFSLFLFACFCVAFGFSQVSESFDGLTQGAYGNYTYNGFEINNGLCNSTNALSGNAVRLRNATTSLEYVGSDGNGKDGGVGDISFWYRAWDNSPAAVYDVEISVNNGAYVQIGSQISTTSTTYTQWSHTLNNVSDNIKVRISRVSGERIHIDDFIITNYASTDDVDWANVQSPANGNIDLGNPFNVYAQTWEAGVTDAPGQGAGVQAWIGYSTTNTDPSGGGWTWVAATYNGDANFGANDEYVADIGSVIPAIGTYYYASRFQLNSGPYRYGAYSAVGGGFWDGITNVNGVLTINARTLDWCNLQHPGGTNNITTGTVFDVFGQIYEPGVTDTPASQGANIQAWIGYSTSNTNPSGAGWTWVAAGYNPACGANCGTPENNDEYFVDIGSSLPAGTYYYASRFTIDDPTTYYYGGYNAGGGGFWNGTTNVSGVLVITDPPLADVVITEIMYNTPGTDDEWIEICNVSGSVQDLSNYIIDVGGTTEFTFPASTTLANNDCITVSLGSNGDGTYNNNCPFTPDYGIPANNSNNGNLSNNSSTITLYAADGSTISDVVAYDDGDGADGNGSSLHVIDASQDNSNTNNNWQEVDLGGSSDVNSLVPNCIPSGVEINVEGNLGSFPDIVNGDPSPSGTDNTLFAAQFIGSSQAKTYRIQNLAGSNLIISGVTLTGDTADFNVTIAPPSPVIYGTPSIFEITFAPLTPGIKTAVVSIANNDSDENPYTFTIQGEGLCVAGSNTISPSSGPEGTIVTVTGSNLSSATATFNGLPASNINNISPSLMEVTVPTNAVTGNLIILDDLGCTTTLPFTVIDNQISSCEGGSNLSELFISEVTDATYGSLTYIELYNATGSAINLSNYSLSVYANGNTVPGNALSETLSGTINANSTFVIAMGTAPPLNGSLCTGEPGGDGSYADYSCTTLVGINKKSNEHDYIGLYNSGTLVDEFGVFGDDDWMDSIHTSITGDRGFNFRRLNTATPLPSTSFDDNDWNIIDWVGSGSSSCSTNDYSNIDAYDFSTGNPPLVTTDPNASPSCDFTTSLTVAGTEGFVNGNALAYQWFFSAPGDSGWTAVTNGGDYSGATTATLNILNVLNTLDYQFYCQIQEDDSACYSASDATRLDIQRTIWNGTTWSNGTPTTSVITIIDGAYDTSLGGLQDSFEACNLIINAGNQVFVRNGDYIRVVNDVVINGVASDDSPNPLYELTVETQGAFVQDGDGSSAGSFTLGSDAHARVLKTTATFDSSISGQHNYTYWSIPTHDPNNVTSSLETIESIFPNPVGSRRYYFTAQNFIDATAETGNNNATVDGQDDIDDNGDDWQNATGVLEVGRGYAVTAVAGPPAPGGSYSDAAVFSGEFNTGDIPVTIYKNNNETEDNNWNFIGNPYPSAIDVDLLFTANIDDVPIDPNENAQNLMEGAIFLWSQRSAAEAGNNGNEAYNFNQNDYAIINRMAASSGNPGTIPNRFIPSGQGFFIAYTENLGPTQNSNTISSTNILFTNSMRVTGNNDQFFSPLDAGSSNRSAQDNNEKNLLWLDLTSDNGVFSQIVVGYSNGATDAYDGWSYDTPRNLSTGPYSILYSIIDGYDKKFAIQGKSLSSLTQDEVVELGFSTGITDATTYKISIAQFEGAFMFDNDIFIKDKYQNNITNLKESDYLFTSKTGDFKDRFEIAFSMDPLSNDEYKLDENSISIIELNNGDIKFRSNSSYLMKRIDIYDLLGRPIYNLNAENSSEITFTLSNLSQATYLAKVHLNNGIIVTKKAVKRR